MSDCFSATNLPRASIAWLYALYASPLTMPYASSRLPARRRTKALRSSFSKSSISRVAVATRFAASGS
jgi:hypothetical protein